jgi:uncharacterized membrane protein required for colicin V production
MNWLTIVLLVFIGLLSFRAYRNGFVRELVSLSAVILAIPLAGIFYDDMLPKVDPIIDNEKLASLISFLAIFLGVVIAGQVASYLLREAVRMLNLGALDSVAGGLFGFLKAVIAAQAVLSAFVLFPSPDLHGSIEDSELAQRLLDTAPLVLALLPGQFDRAIELFQSGTEALEERLPAEETREP